MASPCSRLRCEVSCAADACLDRVAPDAVESARIRSAMEPPAGSSTDSCAAIYGLASSMPSGPVSDVLRLYTDITLRA